MRIVSIQPNPAANITFVEPGEPFKGPLRAFYRIGDSNKDSGKKLSKILHFATTFLGKNRLSKGSNRLLHSIDFDSPKDLYRSIPGSSPKHLFYLGQGYRDRYFSRISPGSIRKKGSKFFYGDLDGKLNLNFKKSKVTDSRNFFFNIFASFYLQDIPYRSLIHFGEEMMSYVDIHKGNFDSMSKDFKVQMPKTNKFFSKYFTNNSNITWAGGDKNSASIYYFDLNFVFKVHELKEKYPHLQKFLVKFKRSLILSFDLLDSKGNLLLKFKINSKKRVLSVRYMGNRFGLFPFNPNTNKPLIKAKRASLNSDFYFHIRNSINIFGLKIKFKNLKFFARSKYYPGKHHSLKLSMKQAPVVNQSGSFAGLFPGWLIDLLIPGSMEEMFNDFFTTFIKGNNGKGFFINSKTSDRPTKQNIYTLETEGEMYHNGLIDFAMKIIYKIWAQYEKGIAQGILFWANCFEHLKEDFYWHKKLARKN